MGFGIWKKSKHVYVNPSPELTFWANIRSWHKLSSAIPCEMKYDRNLGYLIRL